MYSKLFWGVSSIALSLAATAYASGAQDYTRDDPANPSAPVPPAHYHAIIKDYRATPIMTKPGNWRALNDRAEKIGGPRGQLREVFEPVVRRKKKK